jgi:hypothetical protein
MLTRLFSTFAVAALLGTAVVAENAAGTAEDPLPLNNYRCWDFGLVQVAFARGRAIILMDGRALSLPYVTELPEGNYLYANSETVMILGDELSIGPRIERAGAIARPTRWCWWEAKAQL